MKKKSEQKEKHKLGKKEIEELIVKLSKQGMTATKIGQTLKDTYGNKSVKSLGMKIKKVMKENGIKEIIPNDFQDLLKKAEALKQHRVKNKMDMASKRGLQLTEAKIRSLAQYYKKKGILPADWKY